METKRTFDLLFEKMDCRRCSRVFFNDENLKCFSICKDGHYFCSYCVDQIMEGRNIGRRRKRKMQGLKEDKEGRCLRKCPDNNCSLLILDPVPVLFINDYFVNKKIRNETLSFQMSTSKSIEPELITNEKAQRDIPVVIPDEELTHTSNADSPPLDIEGERALPALGRN